MDTKTGPSTQRSKANGTTSCKETGGFKKVSIHIGIQVCNGPKELGSIRKKHKAMVSLFSVSNKGSSEPDYEVGIEQVVRTQWHELMPDGPSVTGW